MNSLLTLGAALALAGAAAAAEHPAGAAMPAMETPAGDHVTLTGEVLDMSCYAMKEAHGKKHADCAKACLKGGAPAGLLTQDGAVYLLVDDHKDKKAYGRLKELGGADAEVSGMLYKRGGMQIVAVEKVEKAKSAP